MMKKYTITVNDVVYHVTLEGESALPAAPYTKPHPARAVRASQPEPKAAPVPQAKTAQAPPPTETAPAADMAPSDAEWIAAPMPGTILSVHVAAGSVVKCGQVLMTLEAMKMENEIMAPRDGRVDSVHVEKGSSVESGTLLCVIQ